MNSCLHSPTHMFYSFLKIEIVFKIEWLRRKTYHASENEGLLIRRTPFFCSTLNCWDMKILFLLFYFFLTWLRSNDIVHNVVTSGITLHHFVVVSSSHSSGGTHWPPKFRKNPETQSQPSNPVSLHDLWHVRFLLAHVFSLHELKTV